ncbi:MAG: PD40 domain-containing protein [Planctomycetes bacterium]|nr:PD40 domain-containing protein [Planctomycetota bacterium]
MKPIAVLSFCMLLAAAGAQSPSGSIAYAVNGRIELVDVASGECTVLVEHNTYDRPLHWLPDGSRLCYWNHDGGAWDLWTVDPENLERTNLTRSARDNRSPAASPDGSLIAFHRGGDGVWLMAPDGSRQRRIHALGHRDDAPVWAPSGRRLAFVDFEPVGDDRVRSVIHLVELGAGAAAEEAEMPASRALGSGEPMFFLDEQELVIAAAHEGRPDLLALDLDTGVRRPLTATAAREFRAVLAPDRRRMAWIESGGDADGDRLLVQDVADGEPREVAHPEHWYAAPSFAPDGNCLAFESGPARDARQVFVVGLDGGLDGGDSVRGPRQVTRAGGSFPAWRPR